MSDVRRAYLTGHDEEVLLYDSGGPFAIVPWEEWERLQAVVDAARPYMCAGDDCTCDLCIAIRALDGEVKPCPLCDGSGLDESGERQCQRCNGRGRLDGELKP